MRVTSFQTEGAFEDGTLYDGDGLMLLLLRLLRRTGIFGVVAVDVGADDFYSVVGSGVLVRVVGADFYGVVGSGVLVRVVGACLGVCD